MSAGATSNIHATAIVVGATGLLFIGPSGCGKSMLAFTCLTEAARAGISAFLIGDDQVFISSDAGKVVAAAPPRIAGLMELRGTGLVRYDHLPSAQMHYAVLPGVPFGEDRLPPEDEIFQITSDVTLPAIRLLSTNPVPLASLMAYRPDIGRRCL